MEKDQFGYLIYNTSKYKVHIKVSGSGKLNERDANLVGAQAYGLALKILQKVDENENTKNYHGLIHQSKGEEFYVSIWAIDGTIRLSLPSLKPRISKKGGISWKIEKTSESERILDFNPLD
jgi:hypothetical protein